MWSAPRRTSRGGQRRYSDLAIKTCLTLRTAYRLGLRQTQGLMGLHRHAHGAGYTGAGLTPHCRVVQTACSIAQAMRQAGSVPVHRVVDSTGLKTGEPFAFAGIWQEVTGERTYVTLTTDANKVTGPIHDRMRLSWGGTKRTPGWTRNCPPRMF